MKRVPLIITGVTVVLATLSFLWWRHVQGVSWGDALRAAGEPDGG